MCSTTKYILEKILFACCLDVGVNVKCEQQQKPDFPYFSKVVLIFFNISEK